MAIKDLAVSYNASTNADAALEFAIQMCRKYGAALTGLYASTPVQFEGQVQRWISKDTMASLRNAETEINKSIETRFRSKVSEAGFDGLVDWITDEGQINPVLARFARYFDLLLIGQLSEASDSKRQIRAEDLVLMSGKPTIVVPSGYRVRPFTEHAVVAWDGSRPSARALTDAMQILETKQRLDVVTVVKAGAAAKVDASPGPDIITHLKRHGIDARKVALTADREGVGPTIIKYCSEHNPDVLVMGAYGHARLREDLFGGVTRHILHSTPVPLLMAH